MTKEINRWGVLIGSVGVLLCTGQYMHLVYLLDR